MKYYIIIPAYNEAKHIAYTLDSIISQTIKPSKVIIVNDNSTDNTKEIIEEYSNKHNCICCIDHQSENKHLPGSKVIKAFNFGLKELDEDYDFIVKLDADLILPNNYFETIIKHFKNDTKVGMVGGQAYILKNNTWILENLTDNDHIRGAFKSYRKQCFKDIKGLKPDMGWDTVDELLAKYNNWKIIVDPKLKIKHLKPTGSTYDKSARLKQGEAFYALGYGLIITVIASAKLSLKKGNILLFLNYIEGYLKAYKNKKNKLVTKEEERFIRKYRFYKILNKLKRSI